MRGGRDLLPECPELLDAPLGRIAGDHRAVDRADRDASDPIRMQLGLRQRVVDAGLVGAECTTALQQQGNAFERGPRRRAGSLCGHGSDRNGVEVVP